MADIILPKEIQRLIDAEVRENGFADAASYQDQKRRAKDELEQYILEGIDSGDYVEMTAETWRRTSAQSAPAGRHRVVSPVCRVWVISKHSYYRYESRHNPISRR